MLHNYITLHSENNIQFLPNTKHHNISHKLNCSLHVLSGTLRCLV